MKTFVRNLMTVASIFIFVFLGACDDQFGYLNPSDFIPDDPPDHIEESSDDIIIDFDWVPSGMQTCQKSQDYPGEPDEHIDCEESEWELDFSHDISLYLELNCWDDVILSEDGFETMTSQSFYLGQGDDIEFSTSVSFESLPYMCITNIKAVRGDSVENWESPQMSDNHEIIYYGNLSASYHSRIYNAEMQYRYAWRCMYADDFGLIEEYDDFIFNGIPVVFGDMPQYWVHTSQEERPYCESDDSLVQSLPN
jgi:hypothetical protein